MGHDEMSTTADRFDLIVNRVGRGYCLEPLRMLSEGIAGVDEIDQVMRTLGRFRTGPFEHLDLVGLDADYATLRKVWEQLGQPTRLTPHPLQADLVDRGHLGRKTGRGFYIHDRRPPVPALPVDRKSFDAPPGVYKAVRRFADAATEEGGSFTEQYIFARTLAAIVNEAAMVLDEGAATLEEIDTAMKQHANYPRGPLEWAERAGRHTCAALLRRLNERVDDDRFRPADWLSA